MPELASETQELLRRLGERSQQVYEAQQPSPVMSALGQLSQSFQLVEKQQQEAENQALESAFKKAQTAKVGAEIDVLKKKAAPVSEEQKKFVTAVFQSVSPDVPVPTIETKEDIDNVLDFMKAGDLHANRANQLRLSEQRFEVQQQQFTERMARMNQAMNESRIFRMQLLGEKDPEQKALMAKIAELDDAMVANLSKAPQIREGLQLDATLATLQAERDKTNAELEALRTQGPTKTVTRLPHEGKPVKFSSGTPTVEERRQRLREKFKTPGG